MVSMFSQYMFTIFTLTENHHKFFRGRLCGSDPELFTVGEFAEIIGIGVWDKISFYSNQNNCRDVVMLCLSKQPKYSSFYPAKSLFPVPIFQLEL